MRALTSSTGGSPGLGMLLLRLPIGAVMFWAGWLKLTDFGVPAFGKALAAEHVPLPQFAAWLVTILEVGGGVLIVVGLLSRVISLLLTIDMVVAIVLVTYTLGFLPAPKAGVPTAGMELNLLLIGGLMAIVLGGPGAISLDHVLGRGRSPEAAPPSPA